MKTATLLVLSLSLLAPAGARAEKASDDAATAPAGGKAKAKSTAKDPKAGAKGDPKADGKSTPSARMEEARRKTSGKKDPKVLNAKERAAAARAKSLFIFAVETCDKPTRCDPTLRDDTERQFLNACRLCASPEKCEAERDAVRAGQSTRRGTVCDE